MPRLLIMVLVSSASCVPVIGAGFECESTSDCSFGWSCDTGRGVCMEPSDSSAPGTGDTRVAGDSPVADEPSGDESVLSCPATHELCHGRCVRWQTSPVAPDLPHPGPVSLALDAENRPHALHVICPSCFGLAGTLEHRWLDAAGWQQETITQTAYRWAEILLDSTGEPRFVYFDSDTDMIVHATKAAVTTVIPVGVASREAACLDVALDNADNAHVIYRRGSPSELQYAVQTPGGFVEQIPPATGIAGCGAIAIDDNNGVHLVYARDTAAAAHDLIYARTNNGLWDEYPVEQSNELFFSELAVTGAGVAHVLNQVQTSPGVDAVHYSMWNGSAIVGPEELHGCAANCQVTSLDLAVDNAGNVHAVYRIDGQPDHLDYAHSVNGDWCQHRVTEIGLGGRHPAIVLDSTDEPHLLYDNAGDLVYARLVE